MHFVVVQTFFLYIFTCAVSSSTLAIPACKLHLCVDLVWHIWSVSERLNKIYKSKEENKSFNVLREQSSEW
jgi:hypothetical protein